MKKILIVEDNTFISDIVATKLTDHGYSVLIAQNGLSAKAQLQSNDVDVLLLDLNLPDIKGIEILKELRASSDHKFTPVIIFSNEQNEREEIEIKELGVSGYFQKASTNYEELFSTIDAI